LEVHSNHGTERRGDLDLSDGGGDDSASASNKEERAGIMKENHEQV